MTKALDGVLREVVGDLYLRDGRLSIDALLDLVQFIWPDISLYPHQELIVEEAFVHPELFIEMSRGGGKSWLMGLIAILKKVLWRGRRVIFSGPSYRQSLHPFHYERELIEASPYLPAVVEMTGARKIGKESSLIAEIRFTNGSSSTALPASDVKIVGERGSDIVVTEAFIYSKQMLTETVTPMLAGAKRYPGMPRSIIYETTAGYQHQEMYAIRNHIVEQVAAGNPEYGFVSLNIDDLKSSGYFPPDALKRIEAQRLIDERRYQNQYGTVWLTSAGTFYSLVLLTRLDLHRAEIHFLAEPGWMYVAGLDVGWGESETAADSAFAVWRIRLVGGVPDIAYPPELVYVDAWHGNGTKDLARDLAGMLKRFDVSMLVVDAQGAGINVVRELREVHGFVETNDGVYQGRRIVVRYPHTAQVINEDHNSFKGRVIDGSVSFPAYPAGGEALRVYDLIQTGLQQFADLKHKELPSGWSHFFVPSGHKKDIAYAILYGWHAAMEKLRPPDRPAPRPSGSPVIAASEFAKSMGLGLDPFDLL
jgi:hypothetical protein